MVSNLYSIQGIIEMLIRIPLVFLCLTVHEFAHGYIAYKNGDTTAKDAGRLTLNPIAHIDWIGALSMLLFRFGWAKPVPVNPYNFTKSGARGIVWVSLAGPLSNFLFGFISIFVWYVIYYTAHDVAVNKYVSLTMANLAILNIGLGVFNLVPVPPLDGSKVLMYFVSYKTKIWLEQNQMMLYMILMLAVFSGALGKVITPAIGGIYNGMIYITELILLPLSKMIV